MAAPYQGCARTTPTLPAIGQLLAGFRSRCLAPTFDPLLRLGHGAILAASRSSAPARSEAHHRRRAVGESMSGAGAFVMPKADSRPVPGPPEIYDTT